METGKDTHMVEETVVEITEGKKSSGKVAVMTATV